MRTALPFLFACVTLALPARSQSEDEAQSEPVAGEELQDAEGQEAPAEPTFEDFERSVGVTFQRGGEGQLGTRATIEVPDGFVFTDGSGARKVLEAFQNIPNGTELGMFAPDTFEWFVVFDFDDIGYVKDDEKDDLDPDEILAGLREGNAAGNEERRRRGMEELQLEGWAVPPSYNEKTNNLEWATRARSPTGVSINHRTKILGRQGVMNVVLVCGPDQLEGLLPEYRKHLDTFAYESGERYSEYSAGDKLAAYGLTALVAGGAGVLAVKTGLFAKFWKYIAAGVVALGALLKKLFGGKSSDSATS
jgi:uncharacterized membrane-anchored protein